MFSCRYSVNSASDQAHSYYKSLTWVNSSASQRAMSSEASGLSLLVIGIAFAWRITHARLVRAEKHQQCLQYHLRSVHVLNIVIEAADEASESP